ncbi:uncharacterized protein LOC135825646 [Sycon ciliatum]|uniref:uncharacterized protein LOC135825646 n=1 Tax=Sycon ciliatum TaxID=27933 RepID=UPI0031F6D89C
MYSLFSCMILGVFLLMAQHSAAQEIKNTDAANLYADAVKKAAALEARVLQGLPPLEKNYRARLGFQRSKLYAGMHFLCTASDEIAMDFKLCHGVGVVQPCKGPGYCTNAGFCSSDESECICPPAFGGTKCETLKCAFDPATPLNQPIYQEPKCFFWAETLVARSLGVLSSTEVLSSTTGKCKGGALAYDGTCHCPPGQTVNNGECSNPQTDIRIDASTCKVPGYRNTTRNALGTVTEDLCCWKLPIFRAPLCDSAYCPAGKVRTYPGTFCV